MNATTLFRVAPTFPIDDERIRERRRVHMLESPVTWGSAIGAIGIGVLAGAGVPGYLGLLAVAGLGLRWFWDKRREVIDAKVMRALIDESNQEQDEELVRIIRRLEQMHYPQYALCVGRFLFLKQKIEKNLHDSAHAEVFAPEIEILVDGVCAEVCREITRLTERESELGAVLVSGDEGRLDQLESERRESHASILHAYTTLYQAFVELMDLKDVSKTAVPELKVDERKTDRRLADVVRELKDEAETIARTNRRLRETRVPLKGGGEEEAAMTPPPMPVEC